MPLNKEFPPTNAIIKVSKVVSKDGRIDHVYAEISYPRLPITHTMKITRSDLVLFLQSGEQVSYLSVPWILDSDGWITPIEKSFYQ